MILTSARFDPTSNGYHYNYHNNNHHHHNSSSQALNGIDGKRKTASASLAASERPQSKRRSSGFLRNLVHESKDVLLAPFHPSRRKGSAASSGDSKNAKDKGTQTRPADYAFSCPYSAFCGAGSSSTASFGGGNSSRLSLSMCAQHGSPGQLGRSLQNCQHYQLLHRMRRSSRARSDPSTRCSLTNLSSLSGTGGAGWPNATCHQNTSPVLLSTSTLASSNTQQQIYNQDGASQNDLRSDGLSNGSSPNAAQWSGSNLGLRSGPPAPTSSSNPTAVAYWQQMREELGRARASIPQSRTLPARLEPSSLLSPDWPLTTSALPAKTMASTLSEASQHNNFILHNNAPLSLKRSTSSVSSGAASPLFSTCCCPNEQLSHRFTSTSSCPSDQQQPDEQRLILVGNVVMSLYHSLAEPFVEELLRYPWGRDSLWLMAFVVFASTLVLLGYVITSVLPTMLLAVCLAICKSLIFRRGETIAHLRVLAASARYSMFTRECVQSLRSAMLQLVNHTLQLLVPPVIVPTSIQMSSTT